MTQLYKDILVSLFLGMALPGMVLNIAAALRNRDNTAREQSSMPTQPRQRLPVSFRNGEGAVIREDMEEYLVGVVLTEMPAAFAPEALKAQAVAARTYARLAWETGGKHRDGSLCTDPACCQGWISQEAYLLEGGTPEEVDKVRDAVYSTSAEVLTYEGELIEATYFSCSGGSTEDAVAVWGKEYPYLQAVDSPGEEAAAHYRDRAEFSREQVEEMLEVSLSQSPGEWISSISYTSGGGVDTIVIGGHPFAGTEVRKKLGLNSTAFSVETEDNSLIFTTRGYGHRVGMSQFGADAMAGEGCSYRQILSHYYPGTELMVLASS